MADRSPPAPPPDPPARAGLDYYKFLQWLADNRGELEAMPNGSLLVDWGVRDTKIQLTRIDRLPPQRTGA